MDKIITIISTIITSIGVLFSILNLYKEKVNYIKKITFVLILSLILSFIVNNYTDIAKLTLNFLSVLFLTYFLIVDKDINRSIKYSTTIFLLSIIFEIVLSLILKSIINFDELYNKYSIFLLFFNLIINIILYLFTRLKFIDKFINKIILSNNFLKILLFLIIVLCSLIAIQNRNIVNPKSITYIINIFLLIFVVLIIYIIVDINYKNNEISNKYNQMMEFMTEYENIIDEQGKRNHEYNNQLLVLNGLVDDKKKLKEYLKELVNDHKTGQNYEIRQLSHFPNGGLKGLLYYKIAKMKENNIKYYLYVAKDIKKPLEELDIKNYKDISKIFGVLIDNAIEGAIKSSKKEVSLDFKMDDNYCIITISNSYKLNEDITKIGTGYSTKGKGHGFGLKLVKDIIKKNNNMELVTDVTDDEFIQILMIEIK